LLCAFTIHILAQYNITCSGGSGKLYDFTVQDLNGKNVSLSKYLGNVVLIANVATY